MPHKPPNAERVSRFRIFNEGAHSPTPAGMAIQGAALLSFSIRNLQSPGTIRANEW